MVTHSSILPGKFHGQKSLVGYSPWDWRRVRFYFISVSRSHPNLCNPMNCNMPGFPVHHQLPELAQTHVYQVSDAIQSAHPLLSPSPPAFNLSRFSNYIALFQVLVKHFYQDSPKVIIHDASHQGIKLDLLLKTVNI